MERRERTSVISVHLYAYELLLGGKYCNVGCARVVVALQSCGCTPTFV
jgi:hypothetical protein